MQKPEIAGVNGRQLIWLFFSLSGRVGPTAYLLAGLFLYICRAFVFYRLYQVVEVAPDSPAAETWSFLFILVVVISYGSFFALSAKRFHDFGRSSLWALTALVADLLLLAVLPFFRGDQGPNKYGAETNAPATGQL